MVLAQAAVEQKTRNPAAIRKAVTELTAAFGNRVVTSQAVREQHGNTVTWIANQPPDAVVYPQSTEDVQQIVRICAANGVAIIPFGVGTSLEGHVNAPVGGVSVDFRDMNRILAVHAEDLDCVIEPGITRKALNEQLRDSGLFFPIDPGADASLGGMAATRCSGTNAVRYGTMKDNVIALKVVLSSGEVIDTARRAKKTSAGYDLTRLMVGSEGTLGIITRLTLKLSGIPEAISGGTCPFPSVEACCNTTIHTIQSGIPVARIELLDALQVRACNLHSNWDFPKHRCCSWSFTAPTRRLPSNQSASARLRPNSAAVHSPGPHDLRNARAYGKRDITQHCRISRCAPVPPWWPLTSVYRSRGWPNA